ncbi:MAG: UDP-N-acetylglucosamine--N-acetylmuramyl-(pentapeptide) pyrophosphoryl-undecaprenol N-acetylglucosamine transferase [Bifidobacteriaceae bacterium]|jgi:UDP-N-acetylglucosamine--N-acetylmuramyl-(pentapeptide) pyrophosphoryl-undecaprenol N-acetylglucosamine transferase|nr:UDP-N-acetylglucosamine--N-acetylmuramyl-(pentapeptide) pyrophosphoryl-undecaprenol N-acetylglucosamine transferase [Bifidobacteriaceae bacterium]
MKIVLAGGGSAGHINPMLALAKKAKVYGLTVSVIAGADGLDNSLVNKNQYRTFFIKKVVFPRLTNYSLVTYSDVNCVGQKGIKNVFLKKVIFKSISQKLRFIISVVKFPFNLIKQIRRCRIILKQQSADAVLGFGGYICPPVYLAAYSLKIPIYIHEANVKVGLANRLGAKFAKRFFTAFPNTQIKTVNLEYTGLPLREEIIGTKSAAFKLNKFDGDKQINQNSKKNSNSSVDKKTLLIMGGSLGAKSINQTIIKVLPDILPLFNVIHLTGKDKAEIIPQIDLAKGNYKQIEYCDNMSALLSKVSFAIARSGASTVLEFAAIGLPACFVPLEIGNGEQIINAKYLSRTDGAIICRNVDFTPDYIRTQILPILQNSAKLKQMSNNCLKMAKIEASQIIIETIISDIFKDD